MAQFTNRAQLTYNGVIVNSNVAIGEIIEVLSATKTAVTTEYSAGDDITYVVSVVNTGNIPFTGITVSDDLGAYTVGAETFYPLTYVDGSVRLYVNGVLQASPATATTQPLLFSGITVPANGNVILIYEAEANGFAPLGIGDTIVNTATVDGAGIQTPITVSETVSPSEEANLTVTKSIEPASVVENGTVTYRMLIQNYGNTAVVSTDNAVITDVFDPVLSDISVTFDGVVWTEGVNYNYDEATGVFTTVPGQITVPAATFERDAQTGTIVTTPGVATLIVTGTI